MFDARGFWRNRDYPRLERGRVQKHAPLEVVSFFQEEGAPPLFCSGTFGSRVMMGLIKADKLIKENLKKINLARGYPGLRRDPAEIKYYLELHIEQGKVLFDGKINIGIVTASSQEKVPGQDYWNPKSCRTTQWMPGMTQSSIHCPC